MDKDSEFLKKLLATFSVEAAEHIQAISTGLVELEQAPSPDAQSKVVERIFREAHSMKGAARSVGLTDVETSARPWKASLLRSNAGKCFPPRELLDLLHQPSIC